MSSASQPNWSRIATTCAFASGEFPQMNIVGRPPGNFGSIMKGLPTHENALTKRACGTATWT